MLAVVNGSFGSETPGFGSSIPNRPPPAWQGQAENPGLVAALGEAMATVDAPGGLNSLAMAARDSPESPLGPGCYCPGQNHADRHAAFKAAGPLPTPAPPTCYNGRMSDPEMPLREQLDEAIDRVRRELEILASPSSIGGGSDSRSVVADLEAELRQLEEARAGVGPHET